MDTRLFLCEVISSQKNQIKKEGGKFEMAQLERVRKVKEASWEVVFHIICSNELPIFLCLFE